MEQGTQVAYIPTHAKGDINHPDCEFGFVMKAGSQPDTYFCRYWRKGSPGILRTTSCSELTNASDIRRFQSVTQDVVTKTIQVIYAELFLQQEEQ